jgi:putative transposase
MYRFGVTTLLTLLFDVFTVRLGKEEKDMEILLLRQQIQILEHKLGYKARIKRWEKCLLVVLAVKLIQQIGKLRKQMNDSLLLFKPETVLGWHKAAVQRKWTLKQQRFGGYSFR